jgi:hypothetical protein
MIWRLDLWRGILSEEWMVAMIGQRRMGCRYCRSAMRRIHGQAVHYLNELADSEVSSIAA